VQQPPVIGADTPFVGEVARIGENVSVAVHHSLRPPRRTGSVEDHRQGVGQWIRAKIIIREALIGIGEVDDIKGAVGQLAFSGFTQLPPKKTADGIPNCCR